ncbi:MAG: helicase-related protein [Pseudomonadota bacterium]|nr:helicase-related protein [Pseudomonadota bacterium]
MTSATPDFSRHPHARSRNVTAVLGPTNTGKTHLAIERMLGHQSGMIGLPLRLLAREVYDKVALRAGAANVALITGEEKIKPASPRYFVCTVEAMPLDVQPDFVAIDEVQLAADGERGHVFTDRLFSARGGSETLLLGAQTMQDAVHDLLPGANMISRPRLSKLSYAGQKKLSRLPRRSAVVAFSAADVYAIAELIRRQRGGAAVVMGALSPKTRNAQVELYQSGEVDFLVATDAIGMGLNLDVDHVAFAAIRKFDGQQPRQLTPAEIGQIAGRAGRHMNDGTFGVTGTLDPFSADLVQAVENHQFEPVRMLQWRNRDLDFASIDRLCESLRMPPRESRLARARVVDDLLALETMAKDPDIRRLAAAPATLRLLWDVCQIPDYRKISSATHAELVAQLYKFLMSDTALIPEDWFAAQVALADRTDGDIDTLATRIAHIRTWTFVSHRGEWLARPGHWQERTRAIEDKLSDALHDRLMHRFVDRRTSVLARRLRDRDELFAEIASDGSIEVERHFVGRLSGFEFRPDTSAGGIHGKTARHAAARILGEELTMRAERLASAADSAFGLTRTGLIEWEGSPVARLVAGERLLAPSVQVMADEHLAGTDREKVQARLNAWLETHVEERLKPLVELERAQDVTGLARGIAFRLAETLGVLRREAVAEEIRTLDQEARGQLRKYGVRFGAFNIYFPALLKPAAADLALLLWTLHEGGKAGIPVENLPEPPRQGLTSAPADPALPDAFYRTAGFHRCGRRVVRIDMLERLADMIRPLVGWRRSEGAPETPTGATGDGGFIVQPDMMSIIGCSGEDFAAVLHELGFRRQRVPMTPKPEPVQEQVTPQQDEQLQSDAAGETAQAAPSEISAPAEALVEVWRPRRKHAPDRRPGKRDGREASGRRKDTRQPRRGKRREEDKGKRPAKVSESRPPRRERPIDPNSPFAALKDLKQALERKRAHKADADG